MEAASLSELGQMRCCQTQHKPIHVGVHWLIVPQARGVCTRVYVDLEKRRLAGVAACCVIIAEQKAYVRPDHSAAGGRPVQYMCGCGQAVEAEIFGNLSVALGNSPSVGPEVAMYTERYCPVQG